MISNDLNPRWKRFSIPIKTLCDDDRDQLLKFVCWNSNSVGSQEKIGEFETTLNELTQGANFKLTDPEKEVSTTRTQKFPTPIPTLVLFSSILGKTV